MVATGLPSFTSSTADAGTATRQQQERGQERGTWRALGEGGGWCNNPPATCPDRAGLAEWAATDSAGGTHDPHRCPCSCWPPRWPPSPPRP